MISKRTLETWRIDALRALNNPWLRGHFDKPEAIDIAVLREKEMNERILRLTRELLDQQLMSRIGAKANVVRT